MSSAAFTQFKQVFVRNTLIKNVTVFKIMIVKIINIWLHFFALFIVAVDLRFNSNLFSGRFDRLTIHEQTSLR